MSLVYNYPKKRRMAAQGVLHAPEQGGERRSPASTVQ